MGLTGGNRVVVLILFSSIILLNKFCYCETADNNQAYEAGDGAFHFAQGVPGEDPLVDKARRSQSFLYTIDDDKHVAVYDQFLSKPSLNVLKGYLTAFDHTAWVFNHGASTDGGSLLVQDNVPWISSKDPLSFASSQLSKYMISSIMAMSGNSTPLYPYQVQGRVIRRLDHTKVVSDSDIKGEYSALVYVNFSWKRNWYGETYFYDSDMEIMCGVTPVPGRIVTWDASISRLMRPPAVTYKRGQIVLHVIYSPLKEKMQRGHEFFLAQQSDRMEAKKVWFTPEFLPVNSALTVPDPAKHLTAEYKTKEGKRILVFDDMFPKELLMSLRRHVLTNGTYFYDDSDDDPTSDNVHWIAGYKTQSYIQSPLFSITKEIVRYASGKDTMYPYDVAINIIRSADHTRIHEDCDEWEDEWTFLVYLNPDWKREYYGETVFFQSKKSLGNVAAEVLPKFGRAVIFQGIIPHSARPPSPSYKEARLSFATKFSVNELTARRKTFMQDMRHLTGISVEVSGMSDALKNSKKVPSADYFNRPPPEFVEDLEKRFQESRDDIQRVAQLQNQMEQKHAELLTQTNDLYLKFL